METAREGGVLWSRCQFRPPHPPVRVASSPRLDSPEEYGSSRLTKSTCLLNVGSKPPSSPNHFYWHVPHSITWKPMRAVPCNLEVTIQNMFWLHNLIGVLTKLCQKMPSFQVLLEERFLSHFPTSPPPPHNFVPSNIWRKKHARHLFPAAVVWR